MDIKDLVNRGNCKERYSAESGTVRLDALVPSATMFIKLNGHLLEITGTEWEFPMSFDLRNPNIRVRFEKSSFTIQDIMMPCMVRSIKNIPEHNSNQLEELKKLILHYHLFGYTVEDPTWIKDFISGKYDKLLLDIYYPNKQPIS